MDRQQVIDALIGLMLLLALAVVFVVPFAAIWLVLHGVDLGLRHYFPAVSSDLWFNGLMSLAIFGGAVRQLRKRRWTEAFLALAATAAVLVLGFLGSHRYFAGAFDPFYSIFCVVIFPGPSRLQAETRSLWAAATIGLSFALGTGLLGSLSGFVGLSLIVAMVTWIILGVRDGAFDSARWDTILSPANK